MLSAFTPGVSPRTVSVTDRIQMEAASVAFVGAREVNVVGGGTTRTWRGIVRKGGPSGEGGGDTLVRACWSEGEGGTKANMTRRKRTDDDDESNTNASTAYLSLRGG